MPVQKLLSSFRNNPLTSPLQTPVSQECCVVNLAYHLVRPEGIICCGQKENWLIARFSVFALSNISAPFSCRVAEPCIHAPSYI